MKTIKLMLKDGIVSIIDNQDNVCIKLKDYDIENCNIYEDGILKDEQGEYIEYEL